MFQQSLPTRGWGRTRVPAEASRPAEVFQADVRAALARLGLPDRELALDRTLEPGRQHELRAEGPSAWQGQPVSTAHIREYKLWLGVADAMARRVSLPDVPPPPEPGAEADRATLELAAFHYLFGDSSLVRAWEPLLDAHLAPFSLTVFVAGRVLVPAGASLVVRGGPAALVFERLVLQDGGQLELYCPCNVHLGALEKRGLES
jgi:hypothetical protein